MFFLFLFFSMQVCNRGDVVQVKVLGIMAIIDEGVFDKLLALDILLLLAYNLSAGSLNIAKMSFVDPGPPDQSCSMIYRIQMWKCSILNITN